VAQVGEERKVSGFGGKTQRKETTLTTKQLMGGWNLNGS
jgi:hypothetical protein